MTCLAGTDSLDAGERSAQEGRRAELLISWATYVESGVMTCAVVDVGTKSCTKEKVCGS